MPEKTLFITANRIGDAVLSTGLLDCLARDGHEVRLTVACGPLVVPLFERHPQADRVISMRKRRHAGHWRELWRSVAGEKWDTVVDLRRSLMPWLLRARRRASVPHRRPDEHSVRLVARTLNLPPMAPRLWLTDDDRSAAVEVLQGERPVIAIGPTANWAAKMWPAERFAELVRRLTSGGAPFDGACVFVTGGAGEEELIRPVLASVPAERLIVRMGLDLPTTAAVFERSRLFIGNDSGLMHMAAAMGTPTIGLFGPTNDSHYAPWGDHCRTVRTETDVEDLIGAPDFDHRTSGSLMGSLSVEAVEDAARDLLHQTAMPQGARQ